MITLDRFILHEKETQIILRTKCQKFGRIRIQPWPASRSHVVLVIVLYFSRKMSCQVWIWTLIFKRHYFKSFFDFLTIGWFSNFFVSYCSYYNFLLNSNLATRKKISIRNRFCRVSQSRRYLLCLKTLNFATFCWFLWLKKCLLTEKHRVLFLPWF